MTERSSRPAAVCELPSPPPSAAHMPARSLAAIEARIEEIAEAGLAPGLAAAELVLLGEQVLEHWIAARGATPTLERREGFRLLALHRQGAKGDPSFNACRETARELVYHYNLVTAAPADVETVRRVRLAALVAKHLCLFVAGKLETAGLGAFCCAAKPVREGETTGG